MKGDIPDPYREAAILELAQYLEISPSSKLLMTDEEWEKSPYALWEQRINRERTLTAAVVDYRNQTKINQENQQHFLEILKEHPSHLPGAVTVEKRT